MHVAGHRRDDALARREIPQHVFQVLAFHLDMHDRRAERHVGRDRRAHALAEGERKDQAQLEAGGEAPSPRIATRSDCHVDCRLM